MKKFAKISAVIAVIMIILGGAVFVAAGLCGGFRSVRDMAYRNELSWNWGNLQIDLWGKGGIFYIGTQNNQYRDGEWNEANEYEIPVGEESGITSLYIQAGGGKIHFIRSEKEAITIQSEGMGCHVYEKNGTLHIEGAGTSVTWFGIGNHTLDTIDMNIYIPEGMSFENVLVEFGGGEVDLGTLETNHLTLSAGAAHVQADKLTVHNLLQIELGAGEVKIKDAVLKHVETSVGAGSIEITGRITGDLTAETAMGSTEFVLYGKEEEHNYEIECMAGEMNVGDNSYAGLGAERTIRNGADSDFKLSCVMGEMSVKFIEE